LLFPDAMKILRFIFAGFLTGFILALLAERSVWLEMRVNTGLFLPVSTGLAAITGFISDRRIPAVSILVLEIFLVTLLLLNYGFDSRAMFVIPASIVREGFLPGSVTFKTVNTILAGLCFAGNSLLILPVILSKFSSRRIE
jgi:hypothetical protein